MSTNNVLQANGEDQVTTVLAAIVSLIHQRAYAPGDRVPSERELTERFGVGRAVVREAMTILESMRYVERRRGSGVFLCKDEEATSLEALVLFTKVGLPLDKKANEDSIEVRRIIEVQAIQLACERRTEANLARLESILETFEDSPSFADKAPQYDYDFHLEIFRAAGNTILVRLVTPFYIMSQRRREVFFSDQKRRLNSHGQHVELIKAIRDQNSDAAAALMSAHIGRVDTYFHTEGVLAAAETGHGLAPAAT